MVRLGLSTRTVIRSTPAARCPSVSQTCQHRNRHGFQCRCGPQAPQLRPRDKPARDSVAPATRSMMSASASSEAPARTVRTLDACFVVASRNPLHFMSSTNVSQSRSPPFAAISRASSTRTLQRLFARSAWSRCSARTLRSFANSSDWDPTAAKSKSRI